MLGEPIIAGKTHSEILSLKNRPRLRWYKTISSEERNEAMRVVEVIRRAKISAATTGKNNPFFGKTHTNEAKTKISEAAIGRVLSEETRAKMRMSHAGKIHTSEAKAKMSEVKTEYWRNPENRAKMTGKNNPFFGKTHSDETKANLSARAVGRIITEETRIKISQALKGSFTSEETRDRNKGKNNPMYDRTGETHPNWQGGISFEPYCSKFNNQLKESIRNRDNRTCVLCGTSEIQNGQRLSVHHIDADKMQGCNGKRWHLCALCKSCNSKPDTVEKEFLIVSNSKPRRNEHEPTF